MDTEPDRIWVLFLLSAIPSCSLGASCTAFLSLSFIICKTESQNPKHFFIGLQGQGDMVTLTWKIPNRVPVPEKAFNNFLVPSLPVKPKRAPLTQQGLLRSGGHRDSSCRAVYPWLRERTWGMDDELTHFGRGPHPRDSELTPRKGRYMLAQHLPLTYAKAKDEAVLGMNAARVGDSFPSGAHVHDGSLSREAIT